MKTKVHLLNDAMETICGAINCHMAAKIPGQEWMSQYIESHKVHAREILACAKAKEPPLIP